MGACACCFWPKKPSHHQANRRPTSLVRHDAQTRHRLAARRTPEAYCDLEHLATTLPPDAPPPHTALVLPPRGAALGWATVLRASWPAIAKTTARNVQLLAFGCRWSRVTAVTAAEPEAAALSINSAC